MIMALILNAVSPEIGGVLIRGERGTAKSTAARALAALLPDIRVVADCPFGCDPDDIRRQCDNCRERVDRGESLPTVMRRTAFVDLPVSATEDRVVGTLDIERAIKKGERSFEPGILASANRGLLYVDEVNLLDDHVVDVLLDSAAMGVNVVEREGISFSHPARFILVGTMNPEEGDLRPQLLDRFALCVDIKGISDAEQRMDIVDRYVRFERDPSRFRKEWEPRERRISGQINEARALMPRVEYSREDLFTIADLTATFQVDGHRADIVILKAATAHAALRGSLAVEQQDILVAAELALPHRLKRQPFDDTELHFDDLKQKLAETQKKVNGKLERAEASHESSEAEKKNEPMNSEQTTTEAARPPSPAPQPPQDSTTDKPGTATTMPVDVGEVFRPDRLQTRRDHQARKLAGRRSVTESARKRGRYVRSQPAPGKHDDVAFDATFRHAAPYQTRRRVPDVAFSVTDEDLHRKIRVKRAANLILFVVDASWSMAASARMEATKGAVMSLLMDAYQRRDRVGVVVFQKERAWQALPFTSSVELARRVLRTVPVGGRTPLSAGLLLSYKVVTRELRLNPELMPMMIVLTDGAANVSVAGRPPQEESQMVAGLIRQKGIRSVVINMEQPTFDRGLAQELANALDGTCYNLRELKAQSLYRTVQRELSLQKGAVPERG